MSDLSSEQILAQGIAELAIVAGFHSTHIDKVHGLLSPEQKDILSRAVKSVTAQVPADGTTYVSPDGASVITQIAPEVVSLEVASAVAPAA